MEKAATNPLVSCAIVCGEYMKATGFFYRASAQIYLITARHNVLPTDGTKIRSGDIPTNFRTTDQLPTIDVYLQTEQGHSSKRIDIRERPGTVQKPEIDVLAVPINFDPEEWEYHVWSASDTTAPTETTDTIEIFGFNGWTYPDSGTIYSRTAYEEELGPPVVLTLQNELIGEENVSRSGLLGTGIDKEFVGADEDYNGLSGSPVIGDNLVGIHSQNVAPLDEAIEQRGDGDFMLCCYTRADVLPELL